MDEVGTANNAYWDASKLPQLTWLEEIRNAPPLGNPRYVMHDALLAAVAPSVPLRADRRR